MSSLAAAPTAAFEAQAFKTALRAKLAQKMAPPASAEAAQKALESGTAQQVGAEMKAELGQHKDAATGGLPAAAANPASPAAFPQGQPPDMAPLPTAAAPSNPGGAGAVPAPLPAAALDTGADRAAADKQLAGEEISDQQLRTSNEPQFTAASDARAAAEEHSSTGPAEVRQAEEGIRSNAQVQAGVLLGQGLAGLAGARVKGFGQVTGALGTTKEKDEAARIKISADLEAIQVKTRTQVEQFLKEMDDGATALFEKGLAEALAAFDAERNQLERAMRLKRANEWSDFGIFGALMGYFWDLDKDQVEHAIAGAKAAYNRVVERVIDDVANLVGQKLAAARGAVIAGRAEAEKYVADLSTGVKAIGEAALEKVSAQFDGLAGDIDSRRDGLIDKLGEKYVEACREVDARAQAFRDANKSWWDRLKEAVGAVIQSLRELKALLVSIATKAAAVARKILADPIGFLKNLVTGVKMGLDLFVSNFLTHLKAGLFSWLFGTLSSAGIQLPERFDAKGIFGLIASVLGLTYANIRARAVLQLGEPMVARLETVAEMFKVLITEGPMGLWRMLMEKLEALKEQVLDQIREMLMVQVIKAGVTWLIGLLNPASAFIKACKAIYDVVMFFIEKGKQIAEFVNAVLDSLGAIAAGQLGNVAKMVEGALAKAVPLVIGFLASLLGLGGMSEKIKAIVDKIQAPVNKAIDWLIAKAVGLAKSALTKGKEAVKAVLGWARAKVGFKDASGQTHSIYVDEVGGKASLMIASQPLAAEQFLEIYKAERTKKDPDFAKNNKEEIDRVAAAIVASQKQVKIADALESDTTEAGKAAYGKALEQLLQLNVELSGALGGLIKGDRSIGKTREKYLLEGMTGTYSSVPKAVGDKLTPDHQPQAAVLQAAAEFDYFEKGGKMKTRAANRAHQGFAINLHHLRHIAGRTFGNDGKKTKKDFEDWAQKSVKAEEGPDVQKAKVIGRLKEDLRADAAKIRAALNSNKNFSDLEAEVPDDKERNTLKEEIKQRIIKGEELMENQDLDSLAK